MKLPWITSDKSQNEKNKEKVLNLIYLSLDKCTIDIKFLMNSTLNYNDKITQIESYNSSIKAFHDNLVTFSSVFDKLDLNKYIENIQKYKKENPLKDMLIDIKKDNPVSLTIKIENLVKLKESFK